MSKAILYYLAAGAALAGGPAAAAFLFRCGQQEAAFHTQVRDAGKVAALLRVHIAHAQLREQARALGVDPDLVAEAYRDTRDGLVTFAQIATWLRTLGQG